MSENFVEFFDRLKGLYLSTEMLSKPIQYKEGFNACLKFIHMYINDEVSINIQLENRNLKRELDECVKKIKNQTIEITRLLREKSDGNY
jgi:2-hydroxy-3-keto-5-methylthiopentenyl-1-phosphate phosphatase